MEISRILSLQEGDDMKATLILNKNAISDRKKRFEAAQEYVDKKSLEYMTLYVPVGLPRYKNSGKLRDSGKIAGPAVIDRYTHGNIDSADVPEQVKYCCCELAEIISKSDSSKASKKDGISGESVQGWSQSYESSESRKNALRSSQKECIYKWLSNTGLLYSGVI